MAKKKKIKNFKVEQDELHAMTIGVFENRKSSGVSIFVIMTLFILVVLFLPQISAYVKEYLGMGEASEIGEGKVPTPINPSEEETEDGNTFYYFKDNPQVKLDDILFDNFALDTENKVLKYKVTNNKKNTIKIGEQHFYLEIFNADKTLLERIKITGTSNMTSGSYEEFSKNIGEETLNNAQAFTLLHIDETGYPPVELEADEETKEQVLVCTKGAEVATYTFKDNLLLEFESVFDYERDEVMTDEDYVPFYQEYQRKANNYSTIKGINSTFFMGNNGFNIMTNVDLNEAERTYIFDADTFSLETDAKVVSFEMEAQGFTCE